ncbi:MAG: excinuclease ABC subunit UvrA [Vampirovibrio sp.]|nr:excinuclease ABC subunit UvrA [Vampirovibrio sp.]
MLETPVATNGLSIEIDQARTNNLKSLSCSIPQQQLTVVTGPSGSGKSSLVFDVLFAEGQRRYLESLSSYAKQFLDRIEKPDVESIRNILPAIALEQKNGVTNARSTVASVTNGTQLLGKLAQHLGQRTCTQCGSSHLSAINPLTVARYLMAHQPEKTKMLLTLSIPANHPETWVLVKAVFQQGYFRFLTDAEIGAITSVQSAEEALNVPAVDGNFQLLVDRIVLKSTPEGEERLVQALESVTKLLVQDAFLSQWTVWHQTPEAKSYSPIHFNSGYGCLNCGTPAQPLTDKQFNYLNPEGACPTCEGYGRAIGIEAGRIIPNPNLTLAEGAIHPFETPSNAEIKQVLLAKAKRQGVAIDVPYHALSDEAKHWVWHGTPNVTAEDLWNYAEYCGITPFFAYLETKRYKMHVRVFLAKYRGYHTCTHCNGGRLKPEIQSVMLANQPIEAWLNTPIHQLTQWLDGFKLPTAWQEALTYTFEAFKQRITCLNAVGLGYLTLNRAIRTLSGGEAQRVNLSAMLGSELTETLYVLDEPTIGLHAKDTQQLMDVLQQLVALGNTVVVVEHDATVMQQAHHILDIGPNSGEAGGELVFSGTYKNLLASNTLTADFLNHPPSRASFFSEETFRPTLPSDWISITGATGNNLKNVSVKLPKHQLVCVTGVSGAGKSSLILETLYGNYQLEKGIIPSFDVLPCESLTGMESFADVVLIDQTPPARSMRSNPATVVKVFDDIRTLFAQTAKAQALGITAGDFSFNSEGGRCETCQGLGFVTVDMQFMADVRLVCPDCDGKRYQSSVLSVELAGKNIADVLAMTINEVATFFKAYPKIRRKLAPLQALGLGYVRLGQSTTTLSGGEAKRLKLATYLPEEGVSVKKPCLFLFDEPTVGLHLRDVAVLVKALRRMVTAGHSVVVIEHHLEFLNWAADWIVDMGPEAGENGGEVVYCGSFGGMRNLSPTQSITADWLCRS